MVKKCIICRVEGSPGCDRSFHLFPKDESKRQTWLQALGLVTSPNFKTAYVCSAHFGADCYADEDDQRTRRKLLSTAVPHISRPASSNIQNVLTESNCDPGDNVNSPGDNVNSDVNSTCISSEVFDGETTSITNTNEDGESIDNASCKRKRVCISECENPSKKIKFMHGHHVQYLSRQDFTSNESWEKFLNFTRIQKSKLAAARNKHLRKQKKLKSLSSLICDLKKSQETAAATYLQGLPAHVQELLQRMMNKKKTAPFPPNLKNFARSLHFHSPSAYEVVRRTFLNCLPSPKTLNKWLTSTEYKPGISEEVITKISNIIHEKSMKEDGKPYFFNLTFDEMSIKQHREWNCSTQSWKGLVDLGGQLNEKDTSGETKLATKALVFLLVSINGSYKVPVAHYLINSLNGLEKSILLKDLLIKLHEHDINVIGVTFDGDRAHKTACELLGAHLNYNQDNFKTYFPHPSTNNPVYIFYDPCHCLKLCRNYFANKGPLVYNETDVIDWSYIVKLNNKQQQERLHCATKIRNRHVNFQNEKMKVFLAAQVLSNSTSIALNFLEFTLKDKDFTGSSPTAVFCKNINDIFDILNVKNKFDKIPGRSSITMKSLSELQIKINNFILYIEKLEVYETCKKTKTKLFNDQKLRKKVTLCPSVCTGFVGLIICLKNIYNLAHYLLENKYVDYVLSYKLSQDHLEMFFSLIRRMNGFNNNPTTIQYLSAYKKLLSNRLNVSISTSANCTPLDTTLLFTVDDNSSINNHIKQKSSLNESVEKLQAKEVSQNSFLYNKQFLLEHDYCKSFSISNEYCEEVINYISGSIVHYLKQRIHCDGCLKLIEEKNSPKYTSLITMRNRGGLNFAPDFVIVICKCTETVIRGQKSLLEKNIFATITNMTLRNLPTNILQHDHFLEQDPLLNHRNQLIMLIIKKYINIRLLHESRLMNDNVSRIRIKNNKVTLFSGQ